MKLILLDQAAITINKVRIEFVNLASFREDACLIIYSEAAIDLQQYQFKVKLNEKIRRLDDRTCDNLFVKSNKYQKISNEYFNLKQHQSAFDSFKPLYVYRVSNFDVSYQCLIDNYNQDITSISALKYIQQTTVDLSLGAINLHNIASQDLSHKECYAQTKNAQCFVHVKDDENKDYNYYLRPKEAQMNAYLCDYYQVYGLCLNSLKRSDALAQLDLWRMYYALDTGQMIKPEILLFKTSNNHRWFNYNYANSEANFATNPQAMMKPQIKYWQDELFTIKQLESFSKQYPELYALEQDMLFRQVMSAKQISFVQLINLNIKLFMESYPSLGDYFRYHQAIKLKSLCMKHPVCQRYEGNIMEIKSQKLSLVLILDLLLSVNQSEQANVQVTSHSEQAYILIMMRNSIFKCQEVSPIKTQDYQLLFDLNKSNLIKFLKRLN